jgi:hypothetical protein
MTELEQLIRDCINIQANVLKGESLIEWQENWIKKAARKLNSKYSVTLKEHDSSAVKQKDNNLVDEVKLVEQIETLLFNLSTTMVDDYYGNEVIEISGKNKVAREIAKLFKTYQNSALRPVKD